ncbi:MAG: hypothetical protein FD152_4708 [Xanthobacteraceae bacterium]|nr:MAG: hypothetical protein FD152_4708 [Xanthobacteraceae bacterium]
MEHLHAERTAALLQERAFRAKSQVAVLVEIHARQGRREVGARRLVGQAGEIAGATQDILEGKARLRLRGCRLGRLLTVLRLLRLRQGWPGKAGCGDQLQGVAAGE